MISTLQGEGFTVSWIRVQGLGCVRTCNDLHRRYPVILRLVRQHGSVDAVTNGVDVGHAGLERVRVHLHAAPVIQLHPNSVQLQPLDIWAATWQRQQATEQESSGLFDLPGPIPIFISIFISHSGRV